MKLKRALLIVNGEMRQRQSSAQRGQQTKVGAAGLRSVACSLATPEARSPKPKASSDFVAGDQSLQEVAMTLLLILGAVTHQRDVAFPREIFDQSQREFLAVILDGPAA